ncbi:TPA: hypothetical protein PXP42_004010 [Yersinia enterocolitica]|nr:hypothetical protein [Yersinia enterocolitica]
MLIDEIKNKLSGYDVINKDLKSFAILIKGKEVIFIQDLTQNFGPEIYHVEDVNLTCNGRTVVTISKNKKEQYFYSEGVCAPRSLDDVINATIQDINGSIDWISTIK